MKRARRSEMVKLGKFHAAAILYDAIDSWDPGFKITEEEMCVVEGEILRIADRLREGSGRP